MRRFFDGHRIDAAKWETGPIETRLAPFRILRVHPGPRNSLWTYVTVGACAVRSDHHAAEFILIGPSDSDSHHETLTMTAYYHAGPEHQRLGLGHTVPIGRPWIEDSQCDHLLASLPYTFGPELEQCPMPEGHVQLLWLIPITEEERAFKVEHGVDALEDLFEDEGIEYWNPSRQSLA